MSAKKETPAHRAIDGLRGSRLNGLPAIKRARADSAAFIGGCPGKGGASDCVYKYNIRIQISNLLSTKYSCTFVRYAAKDNEPQAPLPDAPACRHAA